MAYLKPQSPIKYKEDHIYPLTTVDQVIMEDGQRLSGVGVYLDQPEEYEGTEVAGINADTLGGMTADNFVTQSSFDSYKNEMSTMIKTNISYQDITMPDGNKWDGTLGKTYTAGNGIAISNNGVISLSLANGDEVSY